MSDNNAAIPPSAGGDGPKASNEAPSPSTLPALTEGSAVDQTTPEAVESEETREENARDEERHADAQFHPDSDPLPALTAAAREALDKKQKETAAVSSSTMAVSAAARANVAAAVAAASAPSAASALLLSGNYYEDFDGEVFRVSAEFFDGLKNMGFSANAIKKAIGSGCRTNQEACVQWLTMHVGHAELDTPPDLTQQRVVIRLKTVLTDEERAAKVAELKEKIAARKEQTKIEDAERARIDAKNRMEGGKVAAEVREELAQKARLQAYEEQRRQKELDALAKDKITIQLAADKLMRKGMGREEALKAATTEHEAKKQKLREEVEERRRVLKEEAQQEAAAAAATNATSGSSSSKPWNLAAVIGDAPPGSSSATAAGVGVDVEASEPKNALPPPTLGGFQILVQKMKLHQKSAPVLEATLATLRLILSNIAQTPLDAKKRNIRCGTNTFRQKIQPTPYALSFLKLAGFSVGTVSPTEQILIMSTVIMRRLFLAIEALG